MKIIIFLAISKLITTNNFQRLDKMSKCLSNDQNINLNIAKTTTTEFAISFWIRSTHYHNETSKPFFKIKNISQNNEIILNSSKNNFQYDISFQSNFSHIGSITYSNTPLKTFQEKDFITKQNEYKNWYFMSISFYTNTIKVFINGELNSLNLNFSNSIKDILIYYCLSVDRDHLGGLYFADFSIYFGLVINNQDFENLKNYFADVTAVYLFAEGARKNRFFIPNQLNNKFGPMEVLTDGIDYPFTQSELFYTVCIFQKLFKFKVDDISIINNSYVISCKFLFLNIIGDSYKFLIYGRANKNLDIFNDHPDIINIYMQFKNSDNIMYGYIEYDIIVKVNDIIIHTFSNSFTNIINISFGIKITKEINSQSIHLYHFVNGNFESDFENNVDFSNFSKNDIHYFGIPTTNKIDYGIFYIEEYSIFKSFVGFTTNSFYSVPEEFVNYTNIYYKKRFSQYDTVNLLLNYQNNFFPSYCGNNCAKCDPVTFKCLSCFNRYVLDIDSKCFSYCTSNYNSLLMKCETDMNVIDINFINNDIDPVTLENINTKIFDRKTNEGIEFLINIKFYLYFSNQKFKPEISFNTSIDTYLDKNSFINYFNNHPNSSDYTFNWKIYYKTINPSDYQNVKIFGKCLSHDKSFLPTENNQGVCITDCGNGKYKDSNNICQYCQLNCNICSEDGCIKCLSSYFLFHGECFSNNTCMNLNNCLECDNKDKFICIKCKEGNYLDNHLNKCIECEKNCVECTLGINSEIISIKCLDNYSNFNNQCIQDKCFSDFCLECILDLKNNCEICYDCKNLNFKNDIVLKCSEKIPFCKSCFFKLDVILECLICDFDYIYDKENNKCLKKNEYNIENPDLIFLNRCNDRYFYDEIEKKCFFINFDCHFGCKRCFTIDKLCLECGNSFRLLDYDCKLIKEKSLIIENSDLFKEIIKYFHYEDNSCFNIINNITIMIGNNITTYLDNERFINDKEYEIKEFYIDCAKNKQRCIEYNELKKEKIIINSKLKINCENGINQHIYNYNINKKLNITVNKFIDFCSEDKHVFFLKDEKIICENDSCFNFTKIQNFVNSTNSYICENSYEFRKNKNIVQKYEDISITYKCEYCQKELNYFCSWNKNCQSECNFEIKKSNSGKVYLINPNSEMKIDLLLNDLKRNLPNYIKANFEFQNQKITFQFLKNKKDYKFELKPNFIKYTQNCVIKKSKIYILQNSDYLDLINFENIDLLQNKVSPIFLEFFKFGFSTIIPNFIFKLIQFFDLFAYYNYLEIDGGSFFTFMSNLERDLNDDDKNYFINENKFYEYFMILPFIRSLLTFSIFYVGFLFGIFLNSIFKLFSYRLKDFKFFKKGRLLKILKKKKKKIFQF